MCPQVLRQLRPGPGEMVGSWTGLLDGHSCLQGGWKHPREAQWPRESLAACGLGDHPLTACQDTGRETPSGEPDARCVSGMCPRPGPSPRGPVQEQECKPALDGEEEPSRCVRLRLTGGELSRCLNFL